MADTIKKTISIHKYLQINHNPIIVPGRNDVFLIFLVMSLDWECRQSVQWLLLRASVPDIFMGLQEEWDQTLGFNGLYKLWELLQKYVLLTCNAQQGFEQNHLCCIVRLLQGTINILGWFLGHHASYSEIKAVPLSTAMNLFFKYLRREIFSRTFFTIDFIFPDIASLTYSH